MTSWSVPSAVCKGQQVGEWVGVGVFGGGLGGWGVSFLFLGGGVVVSFSSKLQRGRGEVPQAKGAQFRPAWTSREQNAGATQQRSGLPAKLTTAAQA